MPLKTLTFSSGHMGGDGKWHNQFRQHRKLSQYLPEMRYPEAESNSSQTFHGIAGCDCQLVDFFKLFISHLIIPILMHLSARNDIRMSSHGHVETSIFRTFKLSIPCPVYKLISFGL